MVCTSSECEFMEPVPILKVSIITFTLLSTITYSLHVLSALQSDFQYFCLDVKMSFPPDETNPCIFNLCFFTVSSTTSAKLQYTHVPCLYNFLVSTQMMFESRPMVACFKKVSQLKMVQP